MHKRTLLFVSVIIVLSMIMAACAPAATPAPTQPPAPAATEAPAAAPTEAPAPVVTEAPAAAPTEAPAAAPTEAPAAAPTEAAPVGNIGGQLNILGWEGYDDATIFKPFNDKYNVVVNSTYAGNNDEIVAKYKAGGPGVYDIGDINSRYLKPMIEQNMLMPLDESKLPHLKELWPAWADTKFGRGPDGKLYFVPEYLGFSGICYRADLVPEPKDWNYWKSDPWKQKYSVTTNPLASFYVWAMVLGKGQDASKWTETDLAEIKAYGMEEWKGATTTAASVGEQTDLLVRGDVTTTNDCYGFPANQAVKQGADVKVTYPKGPVKIWVDSYFIWNGAKNVDTAYAWINYAISAEASAKLAVSQGTDVSNPLAYPLIPADTLKILAGSGVNDLIKNAEFNVLPDSNAKPPYVTLDEIYAAFDEIKASAGK